MTHRLVVLCILTACGSSPKKAVGPIEPAKFGDFYAKLERTTAGTTEVPPLGGTVTCWGGPGMLNQTTTEIYMRRSVDFAAHTFTEDLVTLSEGDQSRFIWRTAIKEGEVWLGKLEEVNGHWAGAAFLSDADMHQFYELDKWNMLYVTLEKVSGNHMKLISVGDERTKASKLGIRVPSSADSTIAVVTAMSEHVNEMSVRVSGELDIIDAAKCATMFAHFSPAHRVWPAPDGAPPVKTQFDTPINLGTNVPE